MLLIFIALAGCGPSCGDDVSCTVDGGRYLAFPPPDADGPVPLVIAMHGAGSDPESIASSRHVEAANDAGVLLVAPEGVDGGWQVVPGFSFSDDPRDDVAWLAAVRADAIARFDVDPERTISTGFSIGASMSLLIACDAPDAWSVFYPTGGSFWEPQPADCGSPVRPVRHVHGDADETWPVAGRSFGVAQQGSVEDEMSLWTSVNGCDPDRVEVYEEGPLSCTRWIDCDTGEPVEDCRHAGGHQRPDDWIPAMVGFAEQTW
jgi:polyhydroxybutyrate depolymerase